ncbi:aspartic peptidase domain-containing protein [Suillus spraguei]|nr:aspartic peptidase domain-containing protein [Suillus spraguei]
MFLTVSLLILLLPLKLDFSNDTIDLVQHDKARVAAFTDYNALERRAKIIPILFTRSGQYIVALDVGSPPTTYRLLLDTGSVVTWIGTHTPYDGTGVNTGQSVRAAYGGGGLLSWSFSGTFFLDTVSLGRGLTIPKYELAVGSTTSMNLENDGILGLRPRDSTLNTLPDNAAATYPTFTDWLVTADVIDRNIVGIFFHPLTKNPDTDVGELAFGEPDYTKCIDDIVYTDVTNTPSTTDYCGIDMLITYGDTDILFLSAGIIDTGCIYIYLASDAYARYQAATGATIDQPTGHLHINIDQYKALRKLKFHIGNQILSLTPNAQIWPLFLNSKLCGAEEGGIYLIIKSLGTETGEGRYSFILGYTFMHR